MPATTSPKWLTGDDGEEDVMTDGGEDVMVDGRGDVNTDSVMRTVMRTVKNFARFNKMNYNKMVSKFVSRIGKGAHYRNGRKKTKKGSQFSPQNWKINKNRVKFSRN